MRLLGHSYRSTTGMIAIVPILVALIGLVMYLASANPKVNELGRILFAVGALVATYAAMSHTVQLL